MPWSTPGTVDAGQVYTAARYNTDTVGNLEYLKGETDANGLVFIKKASNSSTSSLSIDNCFSSTYQIYKVLFAGVSTGGEALNLRMRVGGADNSANSYISQRIELSASTGTTVRTTATQLSSVGFVSGRMNIDLTITDPGDAVNTTFAWNGGGGSYLTLLGGGAHSVATAYDGLTFLSAAGATFSATVYVYGYRKS